MILAIRPEPGCAATVMAGRTLGLAITGAPLFAIEPVSWQPPNPAGIDALLVGSANAFRQGGPALEPLRAKPVHAVGEATAQAARQAGFTLGSIGSGGLQGVIDALAPRPSRLLRLAGEEHVPLDIPPHLEIITRIVYRNAALPLAAPLATRLCEGGCLVLLHSAAAAAHFAAECDRCRLDRSRIRLAALGPRITTAAGGGWGACQTALQPRDEALLALAGQMGYS